jgi:hypothetical protein
MLMGFTFRLMSNVGRSELSPPLCVLMMIGRIYHHSLRRM